MTKFFAVALAVLLSASTVPSFAATTSCGNGKDQRECGTRQDGKNKGHESKGDNSHSDRR